MGSPVVPNLLFLSFTSYNPDISSDYRQRSFFFWGNVSLLGYNQIILYSSTVSVSYYPAPGPSFFNTDIQISTPTHNPFYSTALPIVADKRNISVVCMTKLSSIYDIYTSIVPPSMKLNRNESQSVRNATLRECKESRWQKAHRKRKTENHTQTLHLSMTLSKHVNYAIIIIMTKCNEVNIISKHKSGPSKSDLNQTDPRKFRRETNANTEIHTPTSQLITVIMVISTRVNFAVKTLPGLTPKYAQKKSRSLHASSPTRREEASNESKKTRLREICKVKTKSELKIKTPISTLMTVIMVISTRAGFAVKRQTKLKAGYTDISCNTLTPRLYRPQVKTLTQPNESPRMNRTPTMRIIEHQKHLLITVIRAIMVISTHDEYAVKTKMINYLNQHRVRINLDFLKHESRSDKPLAPESRPENARSNKDNWLVPSNPRHRQRKLSNYLGKIKNRYLTDSCANRENYSETLALIQATRSFLSYLWRKENRYLTDNDKRRRASIEKVGNTNEPGDLCGKLLVFCDAAVVRKKKNKQSTLTTEDSLRKFSWKMNRTKNGSETAFVDVNTRISDLSKSPELLSPLSSPPAVQSKPAFRIPKITSKHMVRIVPLPKVVKTKSSAYANSSKAKPKPKPKPLEESVQLVQSRDPRITKKRLKLFNIPLSARNEIDANIDHIQQLENKTIPECRVRISSLEAQVTCLLEEKGKFDSQLEAIHVLQSERDYKKACYTVCGDRMRIDNDLEEVKKALFKQLATLDSFNKTRRNLIGRNEKLIKTATKAFSRPIPLLPVKPQLHHNKPSVFDSPPSEEDATQSNMKPKARSSSDSSMDAESTQGKTEVKVQKIQHARTLTSHVINSTANASDPFFDADATVLEEEMSDSGSGTTDGNNNSTSAGVESNATEADASSTAKQGEEIATMLNRLGAPKPIPEEVKRDLDGVSAAVIKAGGLVSNKPQENRERRGQVLEMENMDLDLGNNNYDTTMSAIKTKREESAEYKYLRESFFSFIAGELEPLIERPDESLLQRIDFKDLLPPPSSEPVPADFQFDASMPEYVREQKIEFLLVQKPAGTEQAWAFPNEENLHRIWTDIRNKLDSDYILDVCLWCRLDKTTGIASIMLSTVNLQVMAQVRHEIRTFEEIEGLRFETYCKTLFIKRYGISMYVPKEHAGLSPQRILRALFYKQRDLYTRNVRLLSKHRFKANAPGFQLGQRSRIGDAILLFDSPELADKLKRYDEEHRFVVSKGFNVTLKGGMRGEGHQSFSPEMTSSVIVNAADQAMKSAMTAHGQE